MRYLLLILFIVSLAWADYPAGTYLPNGRTRYIPAYGSTLVQDYIYNSTKADTIIWEIMNGTGFWGFNVIFDSIATNTAGLLDSIHILYRTIPDPTYADTVAGTPFIPLTIYGGTTASQSKSSAYYFNPVAGALYQAADTTGYFPNDYIQVIIDEFDNLLTDSCYYRIWPKFRAVGIR